MPFTPLNSVRCLGYCFFPILALSSDIHSCDTRAQDNRCISDHTLQVSLLQSSQRIGLRHLEHAKRCKLNCNLHTSTSEPHLDDERIYLHHTPKVAGCSLIMDAEGILGRNQIYSRELCWPQVHRSMKSSVVALREPRDHVVSMFNHCNSGMRPPDNVDGDMAETKALELANAATWTSFAKWVHAWRMNSRSGHIPYDEDPFLCYRPVNLMTQRLTCESSKMYEEYINVSQAIDNMNAADVVVIAELYQESICLIEAQYYGKLPSYCNCEDSTNWASFKSAHADHCITSHFSLDSASPTTLEDVDAITQDDRKLYQAGVQRFAADVERVEQQHSTKILCRSLPTTS